MEEKKKWKKKKKLQFKFRVQIIFRDKMMQKILLLQRRKEKSKKTIEFLLLRNIVINTTDLLWNNILITSYLYIGCSELQ